MARKPGEPYEDGEITETDYDVTVFENRFPTLMQVLSASRQESQVNRNLCVRSGRPTAVA